jgi:hypothetical protein
VTEKAATGEKLKMENIQHSIFNAERRSVAGARPPGRWALMVECSMLNVLMLFLLLAPFRLPAQVPPQIPQAVQAQLQVAQPAVDATAPVTATAVFDPPTVRVGEKTFYRVTVSATESAIQWPAEIAMPPGLKFGASARGQITQFLGNNFRVFTSFIYEMRPAAAGHFTITNFSVDASGPVVEIPAASLDVVADSSNLPPARMLTLDLSATNVFIGQPFRIRVLLPAGAGNQIEALREIQLSGGGLMIDKTAMRQSIEVANVNGQLRPAFICELTVTPIAAGAQEFFAQGFTAGREFSGPISIRGQVTIPGGPAKYVLLVSEPAKINVRPLPADSEPAGFTGAMGKFFRDPPQLSTNRLRVGEPIHLKIVFHGEGDLTRFVPPAPPRSRDWQVIADNPPATGFTLIPLTDEARATPAIPFSGFDPVAGKYFDLTIPPLPVTVVGEGLPAELPVFDDDAKSAAPLKLSSLAPTPGKTVASLKPLQLQGWFVFLQLVPVAGFLALWQWDRRRRFLQAHPEIVRRRQAKRALRREKLKLQTAVAAGDADAFVRHAADALCIAVAPNYPANPQALVCADVLAQLAGAERNSLADETVRRIFTAADAQFAITPETQADLLALQAEVETVLLKLEEKL